MDFIPFEQRFGLSSPVIITNDFPESARIGLNYIIDDLLEKNFLHKEYDYHNRYQHINCEIGRLCRNINIVSDAQIHPLLYQMEWVKVYELIERLYLKLESVNKYDINGNFEYEITSIGEVQDYFTKEIKNLMIEEKHGYDFNQCIFMRKGYIQTTKSINKVMPVLAEPKLTKTRIHYMKAIEYFYSMKNPDYENTIKESVCALEASLIALFSPEIAKNFDIAIRKLEGIDTMQAPAPIIESIIKIYGYRNSGSGVAHATDKGLKVSEKEAELIMALTASYITYFHSLLNKNAEEEIPF